MTQTMFRHPMSQDSYTDHLLRQTKYLLEELRFFRQANGASIYTVPTQYVHWEHKRNTPKAWVKWVAPIFTNNTSKNGAVAVFGKEPSPISALGDRPVSAYIRFLLFKKKWEFDKISRHLIDEHGYRLASANPMIYRVFRNVDAQFEYFVRHKEADLFPEGVIKPN